MNRWVATLLFLAVSTLMVAGTAGAAAIRVSYVEGGVFQGASAQGPWHPIASAQTLDDGGFVRTADDGIAELTLTDDSVVRLAPGSLYEIQEAVFASGQPRRYVARLFFGKLWANVRKTTSQLTGRFETRIPTAVIGVRGTRYNLAQAPDRSAEIFVYEGVVGVGPPVLVEGGAHDEVAWPSQVTEKQWAEIVLGKLQQLRIDADGRPGKPQHFDPQAVRDRWVAFNMERDARRP